MEENQKISKIISEFSLYLLKLNKKDLKISLKKEEDAIFIIFECGIIEEKILKEMNHLLQKKREQSFEFYGWELIGQADSDNELGLIGNLIDKFNYKIKDGKVLFELVRYEV